MKVFIPRVRQKLKLEKSWCVKLDSDYRNYRMKAAYGDTVEFEPGTVFQIKNLFHFSHSGNAKLLLKAINNKKGLFAVALSQANEMEFNLDENFEKRYKITHLPTGKCVSDYTKSRLISHLRYSGDEFSFYSIYSREIFPLMTDWIFLEDLEVKYLHSSLFIKHIVPKDASKFPVTPGSYESLTDEKYSASKAYYGFADEFRDKLFNLKKVKNYSGLLNNLPEDYSYEETIEEI